MEVRRPLHATKRLPLLLSCCPSPPIKTNTSHHRIQPVLFCVLLK